MTLMKLKEELGKSVFGISPKQAKEQGICIQCKEEAGPRCYSDAGKREFAISGLCEVCFDNMFKDDK